MRAPILASYVLLVAFIIVALLNGDPEFMLYAGILVPFILLVHWSDKKFSYRTIALWGFAVWMLLHLLGGLTSIGGVRTYEWMIIPLIGAPYSILKYDQVVHVFCYIVISMLLASIVTSLTTKKAAKAAVFVVIVLASIGVGAINEIIEFIPVVLFDSPGPGGYINTAIDLVANLIGAIIGTWLFMKK